MNIFLEPNASFFFFFFFCLRKVPSCLQNASLALSCSSFIAMDFGCVGGLSSQNFSTFLANISILAWKKTEDFQAFICVRKKKISFIRNWILYLLHCIFFPGSLPSCFHALIFQSFCCNLFCFSSKNFRIYYYYINFSSVQLLSSVWLFATLWTAAHQVSLCITNSQSLLKLMSIELVMPSNNPTILLLLYSI